MIFGNKKDFAIECSIKKNNKQEPILGHIAIWINKEQLGQFALTVPLKIPVTCFKSSITKHNSRKGGKFNSMCKSEVYDFFESTLWGEPEENKSRQDIVREFQKYQQFNICANFSESFDGESLYLIENDDKERFIWKSFYSEEVKEIYLESGTFKKVVKSFLSWFGN